MKNLLNKTLKVLKESLNIFLTILMFTVLPIAIFTLISFKSPVLFNIRSYVVVTGSMEPLISVGSVVYSMHKSSYDKGDIITFKKGEITVTHRITDIKRSGDSYVYLTKGDANNVVDVATVTKDMIVGAAQFHLPYIGSFIAYLKTAPGFISMIVIPVVGFILIELWNIKMELEREWERKMYKRLKGQMGFNNMASENFYNEIRRPIKKS